MKELSIKEKAKAYDDALKVLHKYDGANIMFTQDLKEEMFPELKKESEDERIRKSLLDYLHTLPNHFSHNGGLVTDWIAWLEKHGELAFHFHQLEEYIMQLEKQSEQKSLDEIAKEVTNIAKEVTKDKDAAISFLKSTGIINENGELADEYKIEQDEQKPVDYENVKPQSSAPMSYGKKLEKRMNEACHRFFAPNTDNNRYSASDLFYAGVKAERDLNISAWNEEDETMVNSIISLCDFKVNIELHNEGVKEESKKVLSWLNELKDRVQPQPKQEWSEEDETMLTDLRVIIHTYFSEISGIPFKYDLSEDKIRTWLKSLRPQTTWKPSDEQMEALKSSTYCQNEQMSKVLFGLYQDLKKLREE